MIVPAASAPAARDRKTAVFDFMCPPFILRRRRRDKGREVPCWRRVARAVRRAGLFSVHAVLLVLLADAVDHLGPAIVAPEVFERRIEVLVATPEQLVEALLDRPLL